MEENQGINFYNLAQERISILEVYIQPEDIADECIKIAELLEKAGDYQDAAVLAKQYAERAAKEKERALLERYNRAEQLVQNAKKAADYDRAINMFRELGKYSDAQKKKEAYIDAKMRYIRKKNFTLWLKLALLVLACFLGGARTYQWMKTRHEKLQEQSTQEQVKQTEKKKDSAVENIADVKAGDEVYFGNYRWKVVSLEAGIALLIAVKPDKYENLAAKCFHDKDEETTWKDSSLRAWLNGEFLEEGFTEEERKMIELTTVTNEANSEYASGADEDTQDYVYLLSEQEAQEMWSTLEKFGLDWILRTSGKHLDSVMYISSEHQMDYYGVNVTRPMYLRPVIRVRIAQQ